MKIMQLCVGPVATNCYIVYDENSRGAAVIDPGDNAPSILHAIAEEKLTVKYVLLTHAHFDHILAAHEVLEKTGAKYVVPEGDLWLLKHENMRPFRALARGYVEDTPDIVATEGTQFRHECGRCDLEGGDFSQMLHSLKRLHDLEGDYKVLPGHEGLSTLSEERVANSYMLQAVGK